MTLPLPYEAVRDDAIARIRERHGRQTSSFRRNPLSNRELAQLVRAYEDNGGTFAIGLPLVRSRQMQQQAANRKPSELEKASASRVSAMVDVLGIMAGTGVKGSRQAGELVRQFSIPRNPNRLTVEEFFAQQVRNTIFASRDMIRRDQRPPKYAHPIPADPQAVSRFAIS